MPACCLCRCLGSGIAVALLSALLPPWSPLSAQSIPSPVEHFGFEVGADRRLANWSSLTDFYVRIAAASPRVQIDTLGSTTKGRPFVMLTVTSPSNMARLSELKDIQRRLADPRLVNGEEELERLVEDGKTVVLITHAIHSTEVGSAQMAARLIHRLATSDDPATEEILDNVVLLDIPSLNPDGTDWVVNWYNEHAGTDFEGAPLPWLYHFYTGHDNNRDWYAFTQIETRLTVEGALNAWRPQIVHDVHQMGGSGARIFFPPYIDPWERNIDPALTSAVNQLGTFMASRLTGQGKAGVLVNAIYDAFTPARAYMHYHAGARILSETASADLATSVIVDPAMIGGGREYDAARPSWNYPMPFEGGEWGLPDIVEYMESGALALLENAAKNRRFWLENFYKIGERAVDGWESWPSAWVIPASEENLANRTGLHYLLRVLTMGDVEVRSASRAFRADGRLLPEGSWVIRMNQPYAAFAQTMLERQEYPDLREFPGGPPKRPYDVTAHTLPLLLDVEAVPVEEPLRVELSESMPVQDFAFELPEALREGRVPRVGYYKSFEEPMEGGWTRWVFDQHGLAYDTLRNEDIRAGRLAERYDVILFQAQSPSSIVNGIPPQTVPAEYAGGIGEDGVVELRDFVRSGGRLIGIEEATDFLAQVLDLPIANAVERLPDREFYVPGSIVRLELEEDPLTEGLDPEVFGWYWGGSRAFDVSDPTVEVLARYGDGNPVVSGWILGPRYLAGKPAIVRMTVGQGSVILFGMQPNYRAQTVATWPLLFNALSTARRPPT